MKIEVEDHGNGLMVIGTAKIKKARKVVKDYARKPKALRFACPTYYEGKPSVWMTFAPGQNWYGSTDVLGNRLERSL